MIDNVILLSSEITKGMKSYGPLAFVPVSGPKKQPKPLVIKQIDTIKQIYGEQTKIYIVIGFEQDKFIKLLDKYYTNIAANNIYIIYHDEYEQNNNGHAMSIAINHIDNGNTIFIQNGILTTYIPKQCNRSVLPIIKNKNHIFSIGLTKNKDRVEYVFYDLQHRWSEILYLVDSDLKKTKEILANERTEQKFCFELINSMIENNIILITETINSKQITKLNNKKYNNI